MIIELPGTVSDYHIGRIKNYKMLFYHFSNNNLSIRKSCAEEIGMYDPKAKKSEDVDICFRVAGANNWIALREKGNIVRHKARKTFTAFIRQIWGWGYHVGYPYAKTGIKGIYLYGYSITDRKISTSIEIGKFPFLVCMFLTDFHIVNLLLSAILTALFFGEFILAGALGGLAFPAAWRYLKDVRKAKLGFWGSFKLGIIHYIANTVFVTAVVLGGLKHKIFLVPSSIFRPGETPDS